MTKNRYLRLLLSVVAIGVAQVSMGSRVLGQSAPLLRITHQSAPYEAIAANGDVFPLRLTGQKPGPKGPGQLWNFEHRTEDGWNRRNYMRFFWWDYNMTAADGGGAQVGWYAVGSNFRTGAAWPDVPYFLRFRVRVNKPILPHGASSAQMKWFILGFDHPEPAGGHVRNITSFYPGSALGKSDQNTTTIEVDAGVSQHFRCAVSIPNGQWVHVQTAWRWGPRGTAYQRIYVNNNDVSRPNSENKVFESTVRDGAWQFPGSSLNNQIFWSNIISSRSRVREDAEIDVMDLEWSASFDDKWAPAPSAGGLLPLATAAVVLIAGGARRRRAARSLPETGAGGAPTRSEATCN